MGERDHGIGTGGAERRDVTGQQSDRGQHNGYKDKGGRIKRADVVQQGRERPRRQQREDQSNHCADCDQLQRMTHNKSQDVPALRAQRHANTDFMSTLDNEIGNHAVNPNARQ